jgi:TRAP-type mannitol/chloroaromatic compound transport system permease large subunit
VDRDLARRRCLVRPALLYEHPTGSQSLPVLLGSSANWTIAALPLFIWMGEILFRTKLSEEMFEGLSPWLGWLPAALCTST